MLTGYISAQRLMERWDIGADEFLSKYIYYKLNPFTEWWEHGLDFNEITTERLVNGIDWMTDEGYIEHSDYCFDLYEVSKVELDEQNTSNESDNEYIHFNKWKNNIIFTGLTLDDLSIRWDMKCESLNYYFDLALNDLIEIIPFLYNSTPQKTLGSGLHLVTASFDKSYKIQIDNDGRYITKNIYVPFKVIRSIERNYKFLNINNCSTLSESIIHNNNVNLEMSSSKTYSSRLNNNQEEKKERFQEFLNTFFVYKHIKDDLENISIIVKYAAICFYLVRNSEEVVNIVDFQDELLKNNYKVSYRMTNIIWLQLIDFIENFKLNINLSYDLIPLNKHIKYTDIVILSTLYDYRKNDMRNVTSTLNRSFQIEDTIYATFLCLHHYNIKYRINSKNQKFLLEKNNINIKKAQRKAIRDVIPVTFKNTGGSPTKEELLQT